MRLASLALVLGVSVTAAAACYVGPLPKDDKAGPTTDQSSTEPDTEGSHTDGGGGGAVKKASGLPCDIDALLETRCRSCHGADAKKAPMALVTYDDLVVESEADDSKTVAELSLARMKSTDDPMPPRGTKATSTEQKAFAKWIADGYPRGSCGEPSDDDSSETAKPDAGKKTETAKPDAGSSSTTDAGTTAQSVCTSGTTWSSSEKSTKMNPGKACITCHDSFVGEPILQVGGTIYPTSHEPDKCYGAQGASVVIADSAGHKVTVTSNSTGNFTLSAAAATQLVFPINVKVTKNGLERAMVHQAPHGDCNACHTEAGTNGAPGRILLP